MAKLRINESEMPYVLWVLDGDTKEWKMYKGMNKPKSAMEDDYDEFLDKLNKQEYPNGTYYNNYIDWVVIPAGEDPKTFNTNKFYGNLSKESKSTSRKTRLKEAESYGWVVNDYQAREAYDFACDYFGKDELNAQIVGTLSDEELASSLAFLFRMNDFREWEELNESVNTAGSGKDIVTMFNDDAELYNKLIDVIDIYNATSVPISGDWDTETEHEQKTIADTFNISLEDAKRVMIDILGFDKDLF